MEVTPGTGLQGWTNVIPDSCSLLRLCDAGQIAGLLWGPAHPSGKGDHTDVSRETTEPEYGCGVRWLTQQGCPVTLEFQINNDTYIFKCMS